MPDEPTLGELRRRLAEQARRCDERSASHVHRETYDAHRQADHHRHEALQRDVDQIERDLKDTRDRLDAGLRSVTDSAVTARRWAISAFAGPVVTGVLVWLLTGGPT